MDVETEIDAEHRRVCFRVAGELDLSTCPALRTLVETDEAAAGDDAVVELDLGAVTFADSSALAMLVLLRQRLGDRLVVRPSPQVRRTLEVSGLAQTLNLVPATD